MAEPLDPAAAGVASALKSLRTRAGLREDRLHGTELVLDTLTGLDVVKELISAGEPAERAIVQAVCTAASTLEPTLSIVADASLGLELFKDLIPDRDLYARDLGQRRDALLRNWDRLHELRSVPPEKAPSPRALRLELETTALTALAFALTRPTAPDTPAVGRAAGDGRGTQARPADHELPAVSRTEMRVFGRELTRTLRLRKLTTEHAAAALSLGAADVARWAAGQELPSESEARALDEYLTARGAIQNLVIELRSKPEHARRGPIPGSLPTASAPTLLQTFQNVAHALRGGLTRGADGKPTGWPRDLRQMSGKATAASTAYGLKTMLLLEDGLAADLVPVADNLREMAFPGGGYAGQEQTAPRPEATAAVLDTLHRITGTDRFETQVSLMESDLGDFEKSRPFIITTMLDTSLQLRPDAKLTETLIDSLLTARRPYDDRLLWPEKAEPLLIDPAPSVAHTARAVRALARVQAMHPSSQIQDALDQAAGWLIEQRDLHNAYEAIERPVDGRLEPVHVRHFTAAWVVKALVSAGVPATHPSVSNAVAQTWNCYGGDTAGLWAWDNGDLPIWMTFDAIEALRLANLAIPAGPRAQ
jgi:hypothetical protein